VYAEIENGYKLLITPNDTTPGPTLQVLLMMPPGLRISEETLKLFELKFGERSRQAYANGEIFRLHGLCSLRTYMIMHSSITFATDILEFGTERNPPFTRDGSISVRRGH
jgi:hypothetical protein